MIIISERRIRTKQKYIRYRECNRQMPCNRVRRCNKCNEEWFSNAREGYNNNDEDNEMQRIRE